MLGALGLVFGALLAVALQIFVTADSRVIQVRENLPGAAAAAGTRAATRSPRRSCRGRASQRLSVNSTDGAQRIASIMGVARRRGASGRDGPVPGTLANTHIKYEYRASPTAQRQRRWPKATRPAVSAAWDWATAPGCVRPAR